ncbi:MAG: hypothetical protein J7K68_04680 [Candidatus Diapherotrites archaeon]|nr:hypothetical protein [Candidatus Diapherotrites archaeon]
MIVDIINICGQGAPILPVNIVRLLQKRGYFISKKPRKVIYKLKREVFSPLVDKNILLKYSPDQGEVWEKAIILSKIDAKKRRLPTPRKVSELYQTHFLYLGENTTLPNIYSLPDAPPDVNLEINAFLSRFKKPKNFTWEMLNLLMCASDKGVRDDLRVHLYILPLDYDEIELLEKVLEYGELFKGIHFPFKPDVDEAKGFLSRFSVK